MDKYFGSANSKMYEGQYKELMDKYTKAQVSFEQSFFYVFCLIIKQIYF